MASKLSHVKVPHVGPKPDGDVQAMYDLGMACMHAGNDIRTASGQAKQAVTEMDFKATAANRIRGRISGNDNAQQAYGHDLHDFGQRLCKAADQLQHDLSAWESNRQEAQKAKDYNDFVDRANKS
jgi:hypothetical protein